MSIASAITAAQGRVANCYTAISGKGGTLPATQNLANMPTAINSIPSGTTPTGTISITSNGTHDVTNYANADVRAGIDREVSGQGVYQKPTTSFSFNIPILAVDVGEQGLFQAFSNCSGLTSVDMSNIKTISGTTAMSSMCNNCTNLTTVDLSSLTKITGQSSLNSTFRDCTSLISIDLSALKEVSANFGMQQAFYGCIGLTSINLSSLEKIGVSQAMYQIFYGCTGLTSINLSSLKEILGQNSFNGAFYGCTSLTTVSLTQLNTITGNNACFNLFNGCTSLEDVYFNSLTTTSFGSYIGQFTNMLQNTGTSVTHTLHFPSNLQSTIQGLTGYPNFGGTSGYVVLAFDLPATS